MTPLGSVNVAAVDSLPPGRCRTVEVHGRRFALCNVNGRFHAVDDACPHRGGPLGGGVLEGHHLHCPLHGWGFDVQTGACLVNPSKNIASYPVTVRDGSVWIDLGAA